MKKRKMNKKGVVTLYLIFMVIAVMVVLVSAFFAPMAVRFNTEMYSAGEKIMLQANESIDGIQNETAKQAIQGIIAGGLANTQNNIEVNNALFQYGWILVVGLVVLVLFLYTRSIVEFSSRGGLV